MDAIKEKLILLQGLHRVAPRCQAISKRSKAQCRKASMRGRSVCRIHGGLSAGPRTRVGRNSSARARIVHGRETRAIRKMRSDKFKEMKTLYDLYLKNC